MLYYASINCSTVTLMLFICVFTKEIWVSNCPLLPARLLLLCSLYLNTMLLRNSSVWIRKGKILALYQSIWIPCNEWRVDCSKHFYFILWTKFLRPCFCVIGLLVAGNYKPIPSLFEERIDGEKNFKYMYSFHKKIKQLFKVCWTYQRVDAGSGFCL